MNDKNPIPNVTLKIAIAQFLNERKCENTKKTYLSTYCRLVRYQVFNENMPLLEVLKTTPDSLLATLKNNGLETSSQKRCLYFFSSFRKYWLPCEKKKLTKKAHKAPYRRIVTKTRILTPNEFQAFLPYLKQVNPTHALAAELYRNVNRQLNHCRDSIQERTYVSLKEILQLRTVDLRLQSHCIELFRPKEKNSFITILPIPRYIFSRLIKLAYKNPSGYLFCQKKGSPLHPEQINYTFKVASKAAQLLNPITPIQLRRMLER